MPPERAAALSGRAGSRAGSRPGGRPGASAERLRLLAYGCGLLVAFGLYLLVHAGGQGPAFWAAALLCGAGIAAGLVRGAEPDSRAFRWGAGGAALLAAAVPLLPALAADVPLAAAVRAHPLWPQILVTLFAARALAEANEQRFAAFWRAPLRARAPVAAQSAAAALALGACLALLFYQGLAYLGPARGGTGLVDLVAHALAGESAIHRSIVVLFCVILAFLGEAALQHRRDREALAALRRELARGDRTGPGTLRGLLAGPLAGFGHTRTVRSLAQGLRGGGPDAQALGAAFAAFHGASRRFVRGLLPFLPLLGFFGTVVGLATAMAALPGEGGAGRIDLSGSLAGLALKFETTLLGILASMVAGLLLALVEKGEQELAAECALLAAVAEPADAP